jgi:hypothetical protein
MVNGKKLRRRGGERSMFRLRKRLASLLLLAFSRKLEPHPIFVQDSRLQKLNEIFDEIIRKERDPIMKARWNALRKSVIWLCSHDGAYRVRLIWFMKEIAKNKKEWEYRTAEAPF